MAYGYRRIHSPPFLDGKSANVFALSCTDNGGVLLCDTRSNAIMHHFQMNATAVVYEWDLVSGRCLNKFKDEHSLHLTTFEMSPSVNYDFARHAFVSAGSRMGFLNLYPVVSDYDRDTGVPSSSCIQHELVKSYGNLSTAVTSIAHEDSGTFIAYASEHKRNALRIIHNPSGRVISNWPTESINLGRVTSLAFAPRLSTLAVGNRSGKVQLFRIITT
ncbi:U3 small nucleolar RNA-associated protein 18 [Babesia sp. Xinjiang]|uniref:U3 small nucleolar RNA-associated protein 18 n=1 Tax=Babesia sp. Xinjiang TaxID=462227 RepID=UPI000A22FF33|nr:U3 small nucleolar RNA-associated protein 18 [Babesia sp. Xinjiang]XP_028872067.1 U3 small nucleolar RNA-associated protein 18 [Babesia sp. Xinjiang]ORM41564.1 U3 small nucleolar RNA-associated protein 18 [Babesia sp. Xinjiang]ORM41611.1 U3 small nucleolar RNA-associated protein 18 [Babesia sp. Xinjiang]